MSYTPNNPNGQATSANSAPVTLSSEQQTILSDIKAKTDNLDVALSTRTKPADTQPVSAASLPLPTGASTETTLAAINTKTPALSGGKVPSECSIIAGSAVIGSVGIDQTTPGTTNKVNIGTDGQVNTAKTIFQYSASGQNTTTTQLASAAIFTGTIEAIPDQSDYSILFFSDQNATITINQYIDAAGAYKVFSRTYVYTASTSDFAISDVANGNYLQVVVTNTGASTTTLLNLNTAYGTIRPTENDIDLTINGQSSQSATIANIIPTTAGTGSTDVSKYRSFSIQILSSGTGGTFIFEGSNDNTNFVAIPVYNSSLVVRVPIVTAITATSSAIIYEGACSFRYMRVRIATTITGGVIRAYSNFIKTPLSTSLNVISNGTAANLLMTASQSGTWTAQIGNTPNTTPILSNPQLPGVTTTGDTGAKTATFNGATQANASGKGVFIVFDIGTVTGTTPTLVAKVQLSPDGGTTWVDLPNATTATLTATGIYGINIYPGITTTAGAATTGTMACVNNTVGKSWRVVYTIGGTTPSFTLTAVRVNYYI